MVTFSRPIKLQVIRMPKVSAWAALTPARKRRRSLRTTLLFLAYVAAGAYVLHGIPLLFAAC